MPWNHSVVFPPQLLPPIDNTTGFALEDCVRFLNEQEPPSINRLSLLFLVVIGTHAFFDALCIIGVLFPALGCKGLPAMYASFFLHAYMRDDPVTVRFFCYTTAAMSLVRAVALFAPFSPPIMSAVAVMYLLEGLILLYESETARTMNTALANRAAVFSFMMCMCAIIYAALVFMFAAT